jgi:hypothetical protein
MKRGDLPNLYPSDDLKSEDKKPKSYASSLGKLIDIGNPQITYEARTYFYS